MGTLHSTTALFNWGTFRLSPVYPGCPPFTRKLPQNRRNVRVGDHPTGTRRFDLRSRCMGASAYCRELNLATLECGSVDLVKESLDKWKPFGCGNRMVTDK